MINYVLDGATTLGGHVSMTGLENPQRSFFTDKDILAEVRRVCRENKAKLLRWEIAIPAHDQASPSYPSLRIVYRLKDGQECLWTMAL